VIPLFRRCYFAVIPLLFPLFRAAEKPQKLNFINVLDGF